MDASNDPEPTLEIATERLVLKALTPASSRAAISDRPLFSRLLGAHVPEGWPPATMADVEGLMAAKVAEHADEPGWWGWYIVARPGVVNERPTLVGSAGCSRWGPEDLPHFGYGVLPEFERRGLATEAATALIEWVFGHPEVHRVVATTFERHYASIRILARCGFACRGVSPDDDKAAESDRQGRGKLLLFERTRAST